MALCCRPLVQYKRLVLMGRESNRRLLPSSSSLTSLAAVSPSSFRFLSMALLRSRAALSSALRVHPMVREHSLIALPVPGSTEEIKRDGGKKEGRKTKRWIRVRGKAKKKKRKKAERKSLLLQRCWLISSFDPSPSVSFCRARWAAPSVSRRRR